MFCLSKRLRQVLGFQPGFALPIAADIGIVHAPGCEFGFGCLKDLRIDEGGTGALIAHIMEEIADDQVFLIPA